MDEWMDDEWMNEWMNEWMMNEWMNHIIKKINMKIAYPSIDGLHMYEEKYPIM